MRVLHVIQRYWPYTGGAERHLAEISERLAGEGHSVMLYTTDALDLELFWNPAKRRIPVAREDHRGVAIHRFPVRHWPLPRWSFGGIRRLMAQVSALPVDTTPLLRTMATLAPRVPDFERALARLEGPLDVVHGMNICFESLLYPAWRAARRLGAAFVVTPLTHLGEVDDDHVRRYYTMRHQLALLAQSDAVLVQTDIERQYLAAHGVPVDRMVRAGVGVNPGDLLGGDGERFRRKYGIAGPIVFYLGTAAYDKGTHHLVQAMCRLWEGGLEGALVLAGPSLDQFATFLAAQPAPVRQRVHVLGVIPEADKRDLLDAGAVMAMPSRTDSLGIVYLEAWLYAKPVIGALAGGVPEVIGDGVDGFLVRFGDVEAIADRLARLLGDADLARRLGEAGRRKVWQRYTWDGIYPVVREAYAEVCRRRRTREAPVEQLS